MSGRRVSVPVAISLTALAGFSILRLQTDDPFRGAVGEGLAQAIGWFAVGAWLAAWQDVPPKAFVGRSGSMLAATIVLGVLALMALFPIMGLLLFGSIVGALVVIALALWVGARMVLIVPAIMLDGHASLEALVSSWRRMRGHAFAAALALLVLAVVSFLTERLPYGPALAISVHIAGMTLIAGGFWSAAPRSDGVPGPGISAPAATDPYPPGP